MLGICLEVRVLDAALLETINDLSADDNILHSLIYFPAEIFRKEIVGL